MLIVSGNGTRCIGNHFSPFGPGDLMVIGSNMPHVFRCSPEHYEKGSTKVAHAISLYFKPDFFGGEFIDLPEMQGIKRLIELSDRGVDVLSGSRETVASLIFELEGMSGPVRLVGLIKVLQAIAETPDLSLIAHASGSREGDPNEDNRINQVLEYILANYDRTIKLEEAAHKANMAPTSFCRYFKKRTRKTFSLFVTELRINNASKLLVENEKPIAEIAYLSGYNNLSNFNRQFRKIKGCTPREYAKDNAQKF